MSPAGDRLRTWWSDDPSDPRRRRLDHPDVQTILNNFAPGGIATALGGTVSLNVLVKPSNRVIRVHYPFVTRRQLLLKRAIKAHLSSVGLNVPVTLAFAGEDMVNCGDRIAEVETYLEGTGQTRLRSLNCGSPGISTSCTSHCLDSRETSSSTREQGGRHPRRFVAGGPSPTPRYRRIRTTSHTLSGSIA